MKFLRALARIIFGVTFIFSGFMKLADPVGTSLIVNEYLNMMHLGFFSPLALAGGIGMSVAELTLGVSVLAGFRMKIVSWAGLIAMGFFTLLTLYLALFNPISDCGCFGEAVHLTNWQTFFKNLILLPCAVLIFIERKKFLPIAAAWAEWVYIGAFACLSLVIAGVALLRGPGIDFTNFRPGSDLSDISTPEYVTMFTYAKDGETKEFSLDALPDSSWTYVDSRTEQLSGGAEGAAGFALYNADGEEATAEVLTGRQLLVSFYNVKRSLPDSSSAQHLAVPASLEALADSLGTPLNVLLAVDAASLQASGAAVTPCQADGTASSPATAPDSGSETTDSASVSAPAHASIRYFSADRKTLLTLNRSNGGVTYLNDGEVIKKWSARGAVGHKFENSVLGEDPEVLEARTEIQHNLYSEIMLLLIVLAALLVRFISISCNRRQQRA